MTGSIGPKPNPRPLILHVDADTSIPYRLAESDSLYLGGTLYAATVSATTYLNVGATGGGGGGGITSIEVTGGGTNLIFTSTPTKVTIKTLNPRPTGGGKNVFAVPDGGDGTVVIGFKEPGEGGDPIPVTYGGTGQTSLANINVNSFAGTGVFDTTANTAFTYLKIVDATGLYQPLDSDLTDLGSLTGVNKVILKDNAGKFVESPSPTGGKYLRYAGAGVFDWDSPTGTVSIPVSIAQGGLNTTGPFTNKSVLFFTGAKFAEDTNFNYDGSKLTVPSIDLTTPLAAVDGGTGATALGDIPLTSFGGTLSVAKGGTGQTSLGAINVNSFAGTGVFDTTANTAASYQPKDGDLTSFAALTGTGFVYRSGTDTITTKSSPLATTEGGTGQTSLGAVNVNSFAGTGVFETTAYARNNYIANPFDSTPNQLLVWDGFAPTNLDPGSANTFLKYTGTQLVWTGVEGTVSFPISISQGGTNTTTTPGSNGRLIYFNNSLTAYDTTNTLSFAAGTLNVPAIDLTTPLAVADGGTGQTSLGSVSVDSFGGTLSVAKGGTGQTSLASVNVNSFAGTGVFETTGYARNTYETTSYARTNYTTTTTPLTSFAGTLSVVKGGTGVTALDNITLDTFGGILSTSKGGTGKSSLNQLNVNSFAGTGVFDTTANTAATYIAKSTFTKANQLLYSNGSVAPAGFDAPANNSLLNFDGTNLAWTELGSINLDTLGGVLPASKGGTGKTSLASVSVTSFGSTGIFETTGYARSAYATTATDITSFAGTLTVAKGGTGVTNLANLSVTSFASTGVFETTGYARNTFETTGYSRNTFETTGYARNTYETTSYARSNYTTTATNLTSFAGTLSIAKGGTGVTALSNNGLLYVTGTSVTSVAAPTDGNYLRYTTAGGYNWATPAGGALDPTLQAIADTPTAGNVLIYFSSVDGAASASFTEAGRAFARTVSLNTGDMFYYNGTEITKIAKPTATDSPGALVWSQADQKPIWITSKTQGHVLQINASNEVEWNYTP